MLAEERKKLIIAELEGAVSRDIVENYLKKVEFSVSQDEISLPVPNQFTRDFIEKILSSPLKQAGTKILGIEPKLTFAVIPNLKLDFTTPETVVRPRTTTLLVSEKYTFDSFVAGPSNRFAYSACIAVSENPGKDYNPLFLYGKTGLGKTHLMQSIYNYITKRNPYLKVIYTPTETFLNDFIDSLQRNTMREFKERYRSCDFFMIDDIHILQDKVSTQEEFFNMFNHLYMNNKQIVIASNIHPEHMYELSDALKSRFQSGLVVSVDPPTYEIRVAILRKKLEAAGKTIPDAVIELMASRFISNVRQLESAIIKLFGFSVITNRAVDLEMAKEALKDMLETSSDVLVQDIQIVLKAVAKYYQMDLRVIINSSDRKGMLQRHICMYLAHKTFSIPVRKIMNFFKIGSTSTIVHAVRKIERQYRNTKLKKDVSLIIQDIKANT